MSTEPVPNGCCWWNRASTFCCALNRPLRLRYDDCVFQLGHRLAGIYQGISIHKYTNDVQMQTESIFSGGSFSRTLWNLVEMQYIVNSNSSKTVEFTDVVLPTTKGTGKHDKVWICIANPLFNTICVNVI